MGAGADTRRRTGENPPLPCLDPDTADPAQREEAAKVGGNRVGKVRSVSFRLKLMAVSVACMLIPAVMTLSLSNTLTRDAVERQAFDNARETLRIAGASVSNLLRFMLYVANFIQVDSEINAILKKRAMGAGYAGEHPEYERFMDDTRVISKLDNLAIAGEKCYVTILLPNGQFFTNYSVEEFHPNEWMAEPWFENLEALSGFETFWVGAHPNKLRSERLRHPYLLSAARTLRLNGSEIYGYVIVSVQEDQLSGLLRTVDDHQELMLVDGAGRILSHVDDAQVGRTAPFSTEGAEILRLNRTDYLAVSEPLGFADWRLVQLTPYDRAVADIRDISRNVLLFQVAAFVVFLLVLLWLIGTFTRPLKRLAKLAETVRRGNLEVRSHLRGRDELGSLGASFDQMLDRIKGMIAEITEEQSRKRKAELAMLQAQINPHFLFNVLNSIRMNVLRRGDRENAEMISSLSRLLRMTIGRDSDTVTLREEMETIQDYVRLMNMRQREKVQLVLDLAPETMPERLPRFALQPVIENALIHGLNRRAGRITVSTATDGPGMWTVRVHDDGAGMKAEVLERFRRSLERRTEPGRPPASDAGDGADRAETRSSGFSGLGLANVCERMRLTFGEAFRMEIDSRPGGGTTVTMRIPRQEVKAHDEYPSERGKDWSDGTRDGSGWPGGTGDQGNRRGESRDAAFPPDIQGHAG